MTRLAYVLSGGLIGYYYQIHRVFLDATTKGIPTRTAMGFVVGAGIGLLFCLLMKAVAGSQLYRVLKKSLGASTNFLIYAASAYLAYILLKNSQTVFRSESHVYDILAVYPLFAALALVAALTIKHKTRNPFAVSSLFTFLVFASYIAIKTGTVTGLGIALVYYLYLLVLGRFIAGGIAKIVRMPLDTPLETLLVSFVSGILGNYVLWYILGQLFLLYSATAYCVGFLVLGSGVLRYGRSALRGAKATIHVAADLLDRRTDHTASVLANVTLFVLLLLIAVLTIRFPGSGDSAARMYCATVFKFTEMHGFVFPPFFQHWPLLYQPLLLETTGLPLYLTGGITALRFFHGTIYFSFIPFLVLLCRRHDLPFRTIVIFTLIVVASSFSLRLAYFDKPSVIAYPAVTSLLAVCLVMLRYPRPWYAVIAGALTAIIYNSKLVLILGAAAAIVLLTVHLALSGSVKNNGAWRRAIAVALGLFIVAAAPHAIQNTCLRGNPLHPFAADVFQTSRDFPEELAFAEIPGEFYRKTMPTAMPAEISSINLDKSEGMYGPYVHDRYAPNNRKGRYTRYSVSVVVILASVLMPVFVIIRRDVITVFCAVSAAVSFYFWFGWIGDGLRYSTFFPCMALLISILVSRPLLGNRTLDVVWRYLFYGLLVLSIPIGIYFTAADPGTAHVVDSLLNRSDKHKWLEPGIHMTTTYLRQHSESKPVLLVADMTVTQYGFFQPNFLYQPIHWRDDFFTNMVYLSTIKPTHLMTPGSLDNSLLIKHYPFLRDHLSLEKIVHEPGVHFQLYQFDDETPWAEYHAEHVRKEAFVPGHLKDIKRFLKRYRS